METDRTGESPASLPVVRNVHFILERKLGKFFKHPDTWTPSLDR